MLLRILKFLLSGLFWLIAGVLAVMVIAGPFAVIPVFGWLVGPAGALLLLLVIARSARRARRNRGATVLNYIKQAVSLNLPIPPMLAAAEISETGTLRRRLGDVCDGLEHGQPVGETLRLSVPEVPARVVDLVSAGERIGRLPSVLERVTAQERDKANSDTYGSVLGWNYGIVLILFMSLVLSGVGYFIMPKFEEIFEDFDVAMPWQTLITFDLLGRFSLPILLLVSAATFATAAWGLQQSLHGLEGRERAGRWLTDRLIWFTPVARSVARDRGLGDACGLIVESLRAGDSMEIAAFEAGELRTNAVLQRRLQRFSDELKTGQPLRDAAEQARLPKLMVGMLATGQAVSDPARVFDFLSRYYTNRFSRLAALLKASVLPVTVMTLAVAVGWIVFSLIMPLVVLIEDCTLKIGMF